jgi:SAM-dependent methyltransferase
MIGELINKVGAILSCPYCLEHLDYRPDGLFCPECNAIYPFLGDSQIDLRLQKTKLDHVEYVIGRSLYEYLDFDYRPLETHQNPEVNFGSQPIPKKFTEELRSHVPRARKPGALALDIGCGLMPPKQMLEYAGYSYIGLDYKDDAAHLLGDAHALPFQPDSFDLIISMNVLEHLQYPQVAYKNIHRILKSECLFIGSVAFLEPFHDNSFYHHTHLGVYNRLSTAGFNVIAVSPNLHWPVLKALAEMDALARRVVPLLRLANWINSLRQKARPNPERVLRSSGSFSFVAKKG